MEDEKSSLYTKALESLVLESYRQLYEIVNGYELLVDVFIKENKRILDALDSRTRKKVLDKISDKRHREMKETIKNVRKKYRSMYKIEEVEHV